MASNSQITVAVIAGLFGIAAATIGILPQLKEGSGDGEAADSSPQTSPTNVVGGEDGTERGAPAPRRPTAPVPVPAGSDRQDQGNVPVDNRLGGAAGRPATPSPDPSPRHEVPPTPSQTRPELLIVNRSGQAIVLLEASPTEMDRFTGDLLGLRIIADGGTFARRYGAAGSNCFWDFQVTFADGGTVAEPYVNVCGEVRALTVEADDIKEVAAD